MTDDELLIPNPAHIYEAVAEIKRLRQEVLDAKEEGRRSFDIAANEVSRLTQALMKANLMKAQREEVIAKAIAWKEEGGGAGQGSNLWGPTRLESDLEDAVDALLSARETS